MTLRLVDNFVVTVNTVSIKFGRTISMNSLLDENFEVYIESSSSTKLSSPFRDINKLTDYNQISRVLTLYWNVVLDSETDYVIKITNIKDSANTIIPDEEFGFTSPITAATPSVLSQYGTTINEVLIEDKSIRADIETGYQIIAKNPYFYIEKVFPEHGDFLIPEDENNGRVIITFNERPAANFLNNNFFKTQRKKIQKTPSRWENIQSKVSMHSTRAEVNVDFPSNDTTPVFYTSGKTYFEDAYKYRIIVSSEVGI